MTSLLLAVLILLPDLIFHAYQAAEINGLNGDMLVAQISQESKWDPNAKSYAGAIGLAGIIPEYHPGVDPYDPIASIDYLALTMREYEDKYGSTELALAAYNAGWPTVDKWGGVPPYEETNKYIEHITSRAGTRPVEIE